MVVAGRCRSLVVISEGLILALLLDAEILELVSSIYLRTPKATALNKWHSTWGQRGQTSLPKRRWHRNTSRSSVEAVLDQPDPGHPGKLLSLPAWMLCDLLSPESSLAHWHPKVEVYKQKSWFMWSHSLMSLFLHQHLLSWEITPRQKRVGA